EYTLLQAEPVSIVLYDQSGKVVTHLANRTKQDAGWHHQSFMLPAGLPAGGYLLVLTTPSGRASLKLVK
ncbi:MAG: T9SS type A sorting domain-containing protein, partial [Saprospiraceae bacterium]